MTFQFPAYALDSWAQTAQRFKAVWGPLHTSASCSGDGGSIAAPPPITVVRRVV